MSLVVAVGFVQGTVRVLVAVDRVVLAQDGEEEESEEVQVLQQQSESWLQLIGSSWPRAERRNRERRDRACNNSNMVQVIDVILRPSLYIPGVLSIIIVTDVTAVQ